MQSEQPAAAISAEIPIVNNNAKPSIEMNICKATNLQTTCSDCMITDVEKERHFTDGLTTDTANSKEVYPPHSVRSVYQEITAEQIDLVKLDCINSLIESKCHTKLASVPNTSISTKSNTTVIPEVMQFTLTSPFPKLFDLRECVDHNQLIDERIDADLPLDLTTNSW